MTMIIRTPQQAGAAIRRIRRQLSLSQTDLGKKMDVRQATVSKLESGEPATQLRVLMDALAALNLELVVQPRSLSETKDIEDLF